MTDYSTGRMPMVSGLGEQKERKYRKVEGKWATWYIAIQNNPGDNIYYRTKEKRYSDGFGGRTLEFELEDGSIEEVQGPWHSNSGALLNDTGIAIVDLHLTQVIIGTGGLDYEGGHSWRIRDVIYQEDEPQLGKYERGDELAQEYANKLNKRVYYFVTSRSGGYGGPKDPIL